MLRIADLLDRDLSRPVAEVVKIENNDPDTVFAELSEYVATDRIKAEYERLFSVMATASTSPNEGVGVWISGFFGSGKSSFAKNLGYVLANREVHGVPASSLFLKQVESERIAETVEFLNRTAPFEVFMFDAYVEPPMQTNAEQIWEGLYRVALRDLDYAEDYDISDLEMELEREGKLAAFQDLCLAEYKEEWRKIRKGSQNPASASWLLHRLDSHAYPSTDTWLNMLRARPLRRLSVNDVVKNIFDRCEIRRPGKAVAFIVDELDASLVRGAERLGNLCALVEELDKESSQRLKSGKLPAPTWIVVTAEDNLGAVRNKLAASQVNLPQLQDHFKYEIELSRADLREVVARRVLGKKQGQESNLRKLFRDHGPSLIQNVKLERCSRPTEFDEDQFVEFYPYLPHLIELSLDILAGIRLQPNAPKYIESNNRTLVKQSFEMLMSDRTRLAGQPLGALVSIDKIYELVEGNTPWEKQKAILDIRQRFDDDVDYPGMAARAAKAICLMELVNPALPRTTKNIAALMVQRVTEAPPTMAVAAILERLKVARFVRETEYGWKLYDFDMLRLTTEAAAWHREAVGIVNPRTPGWRNDILQLGKKLLARSLTWYTRPLRAFNYAVSRSLEEIVDALDHLTRNMVALDHRSMKMVSGDLSDQRPPQVLDHLSMNMVALEQLSMDVVALEKRLAQSEQRTGDSGFHADAGRGNERTAYVIGLFGTGRRYINELILQNIGERAKYFRDTIRLHPGPTPMIYSGHATIKHVSRAQELPAVMSRILGAVGSGFADSIFIYRHPLDSLLTNWVWWRTYIRDNRSISGISQAYQNTDDLCSDLDRNFLEFKAFSDGDPDFFAGLQGPRFLSFREFVEETDLHLHCATLTLRLEDFMADPSKGFSRIVEVMSVNPAASPAVTVLPKTRPLGYLAVKEKVPRFKNFIEALDSETVRRIEAIGYSI